MKQILGSTTLEVVKGDITLQKVDGIVNAANSALAGGAGLDGAIHRAGGPEIMKECRKIAGGCPTGQAVITTAGSLSAKLVIHTVGPVWNGGNSKEEELLASAYHRSLEVAQGEGLRSLAFPSISTGAYRFPLEKAAAIAWETLIQFCVEHPGAFDLIRLVAFSDQDQRTYATALAKLKVDLK